MGNSHRYNPVLREKLYRLALLKQEDTLSSLLNGLSNKDFRTAGFLLSEDILPKLSSDAFWHLFVNLVPKHPKAYLGTFLKAAILMCQTDSLDISEVKLRPFSRQATTIDCQKILNSLLPAVRKVVDVHSLITLFGGTKDERCLIHLIKAGTPHTYFYLFNLLKNMDADEAILQRCVIALVKQETTISFNMASILCQYFGLRETPARFSLSILPYELSRLDGPEENFIQLLTGKLPVQPF